jgi:hypothetical protein
VPGAAGRPDLRFLPALRIGAEPAALDAAPAAQGWPAGAIVARIAPDDALVLLPGDGNAPAAGAVAPIAPDDAPVLLPGDGGAAGAEAVAGVVAGLDPWALVEPEAGLVAAAVPVALAEWWVANHADWLLDPAHDGLAQGLVAGIPVKVRVAGDRALILVPTGYAAELVERWAEPAAGWEASR